MLSHFNCVDTAEPVRVGVRRVLGLSRYRVNNEKT